MQSPAFASPVLLFNPAASHYIQRHRYRYIKYAPPRLRPVPSRCPRVILPTACVRKKAYEDSSEKAAPFSAHEFPPAKHTERDADNNNANHNETSGAGLFVRDFQRIRDSFQNLATNNSTPDSHSPSPVRSRFLKTLLARLMRVQAVIEDTTDQVRFPRFRKPSQALPGSATRRFMRLFYSLKAPGEKKKDWKVLGYFQWQKVADINNALPPSEARRLQRKQRRSMLDGIADLAPNAWRIALQTGGRAVDSIIQSSIDGTRRHNEAATRMRHRKIKRQAETRKIIARKARRNKIAHTSQLPKVSPPNPASSTNMDMDGNVDVDILNSGNKKKTAGKKKTPSFVQRTSIDTKKKANGNRNGNGNRNRNNEILAANAVKLAHSLINATPRKRGGNKKRASKKKRQSIGNERKGVNLAESVLNPTNWGVSSKHDNGGESIVGNAVSFAESLLKPTSSAEEVPELIAVNGSTDQHMKLKALLQPNDSNSNSNSNSIGYRKKWTLDSYETRLFFVVMGALAAKSLLVTITPIVTLVSHAYIISEAQAPRKMPRDILNNYIRRKSRAVYRVDQFVRNYQHQHYNININNNKKNQLLLLPPTSNGNTNGNRNSIRIWTDEDVTETVARQVGASTPAILNAPVVGEVLQGVDGVAYSAENSWKRMKKIVGARNGSKAWDNERWVLLESLEWQRKNEDERHDRRP